MVMVVENGVGTTAERPDGYAVKALIGSAMGYAMDGFDLLILAFLLGAIGADLGLTPAEAASLATWTLIGAVAGGVLFGLMADRFGRVRVLTWTILVFAVFTGLSAFARGYEDLRLYRTIAGLGLGGEFGIGMALVAEAWPASMRARVSSYVGLGWQAGVLAAALIVPLLLPRIGWRGMFALGVLPALLCSICGAASPKSRRSSSRAVGRRASPSAFVSWSRMPQPRRRALASSSSARSRISAITAS